jgi:drug/metabolite transporter (DMT)-like permease
VAAPRPAGPAPVAPRPRDRALGLVLILVSAAAFGAMPILGKVAYRSGAEPVSLLAVRFAVAAGCLLAVRAVVAGRGGAGPWPGGSTLGTLVALGGGVYVLQSLAYFRALELAPAALVAIVLYLFPGLVVLLTVVFLRERPTAAVVGCLLLSVLGVGLTVGPVSGSVDPLGPALAAVSAVCYSVYIVVSSRVVPRSGPLTSICVVVSAAAVTYGVLALATGPSWPGDPGGWAAAAAVGVVGTVIAMLAFFAGLARLGPTDSSIASTLEPVVTAALGVLVLGEAVTGVQAAGSVLVLAAVILLARLRTT